MSQFRVQVTVKDPTGKAPAEAEPLDALVDTGSELSWLPKDWLAAAGIETIRSMNFKTATGEVVNRRIGYAIIKAEGFETIDQVVFAEPGDQSLLGVRTIEGFSVIVDNIGKRLVATTSLVA